MPDVEEQKKRALRRQILTLIEQKGFDTVWDDAYGSGRVDKPTSYGLRSRRIAILRSPPNALLSVQLHPEAKPEEAVDLSDLLHSHLIIVDLLIPVSRQDDTFLLGLPSPQEERPLPFRRITF